MSKFEGYSVSDVIHAGGVSTVYRAVRQSDGERVILKWLSASNPTLGDLARYRLAYDTMRGLQIPGVSEVLALEDHDRRPLLVSRDIGGITLAEWLSRGPLPLRDALATALGVADALARLHDHGIVHRDVNPSNIVVVPSTGQVELIDFDLATRLRVERIEARSAQSLNGTLAYISPEQTGRMNRTVDHRTDLYSLGATLYEMLAGVVPFAETDSAALIHAHLAVQPKPLHLVAGLVPDVVAAITMRLLAKAPEDRYRGAPGLRADLARCLEALRNDAPLTPFPLATKDVSPRLRVSQRLYGREVETDTLLGAFGRASRDGAELVLVDGPSGVGKSALIRELYRPIAARRGRFVWGKYDKLNAAPYAALADALSELVRDILAEPEHEIARWRTVLLEALEGAASVMVELVPNLGLVLGPQPVAPALGPSGAQNRFQRTIMRFIQAFARPEHPLALFVDDLQWADGPTIELLRLLLGDSRTRHLLVVAAWRSGEVDAAHPLYAALETLERETPRVTRLCLSPLSLPDVQSLVADTLSLPVDDAAPLAAAMFAKTAGNPFFLERFLGSLAEDGLLRFEVTRGRWEWDLARIAGREVADNVGELLARKLAALDEGTRDVLRLAACIGSQFDLTTLSVIAGRSPSELAALLWPAVEEDLVDPQGMAYRVLPVLGADDAAALGGDPSVVYRFIHDRIHEAAYALVDAGERAALHLQIGRLLLADRKPEEIGEPLFDVTNHLNRGLALLTGEADRVALARLNREAAARAVASAAYDTAARHAETGWELLPAGGWAAEPELAWELLRLKAQVAMMVGAFDRAAALHDALAEHAADVGRSVDVVLMRMVERMRASDSAGAIAHGLEGLKPFGFSEPADPDGWGALIGAEAAFVASYLAVHPVESLGSLRAAQDPSAIQQMRVLALMGSPAYTMPHVMAYLTCRIVRLSIEFGCTPDTPLGFVLFGVSSCMQGDMERGDAFGRLGLALHDRLGGGLGAEAPLQHLYATFIHHWRSPLSSTLRRMERARNAGLQSGNYETAGWAAMNVPWLAFASGAPLQDTRVALGRNLEIARDTIKHVDIVHALTWTELQVARLMGHDERRRKLAEDGLTEPALLERLAHFVPMLAANRVQRLKTACILEGWHECIEDLEVLETLLPAAAGSVWAVEGIFYGAMVRTALLDQREGAARQAWHQRIVEAAAALRGYAAHGPENVQAKYLLVEAELHAIDGRREQAAELYERAVEVARGHGQLPVEGLASERAASFHERAGHPRLSKSYSQDAHLAWVRWGARARADAIERRRPELRSRHAGATIRDTVTTHQGDLDIVAVLEATRAISGEIVLEDLLARIMTTMIANAGAERGSLILHRGDELRVEAHVAAAGEAPTVLRSVPLDEAAVPASIVRFVDRTGEAQVIGDASSSGRFGNDPYIQARQPRSVLCTPIREQNRPVGVLYLENRLVTDCFTDDRCALLNVLSAQAAISISNALLFRQQQEMAASMQRFVPQRLLHLLGKESILDVALGDAVERPMTVLFADIRGFTPLSAQMAPQRVFEFLNRYLAEVGPVIRAHGGFIDKYIGDAVMALFPDSARDGVAAAAALLEVVARHNHGRSATEAPQLRVGIGLHRGSTMLGTIGERMRLEGTVISDAVNTASRLEGMTKALGADALCSASTFAEVGDAERFPHRYVGALTLRGREGFMPAVELLSADDPDALARRLQTRATFEAAARALDAGGPTDRLDAVEGFAAVLQADPGDRVARALWEIANRAES